MKKIKIEILKKMIFLVKFRNVENERAQWKPRVWSAFRLRSDYKIVCVFQVDPHFSILFCSGKFF